MCCCREHCRYSLHTSGKVKQEVLPLAMNTEVVSMGTLLAMEENQTSCDELGSLVGLFDSLSLDVCAVFGQ